MIYNSLLTKSNHKKNEKPAKSYQFQSLYSKISRILLASSPVEYSEAIHPHLQQRLLKAPVMKTARHRFPSKQEVNQSTTWSK